MSQLQGTFLDDRLTALRPKSHFIRNLFLMIAMPQMDAQIVQILIQVIMESSSELQL